MKIELQVNNYLKELCFNQILCINANCDNQEIFNEVFLDGLKKKNKIFTINGTSDFEEYEILEYSGNSIVDDLKLTKKSINYQLLDNISHNVDLDYYDELNKMLEIFKDAINEKYDLLINSYPEMVNPCVKINNFNELIKKCYQMIDIDEVNSYLGAELQIMMLINYAKQNKNKNFFLILNNLDKYLDLSQMLYIVDQIYLQENIHAVILQKNFDFCAYTTNIVSNYILSDYIFINYKEIKEDVYDVKCFNYLTNNEKNVILQYLSKEKNKKTYYKHISEKKIEIF